MKTIHLIRHAKSSWDNPQLTDVNRPLSNRGINDCQIMAEQILAAGWDYSHIHCSVARRAQLTIQGITSAIKNIDFNWQVDRQLYTFSSEALIIWLGQLNDEINEVTLVGHNPAFTDLVNEISDGHLNNLPTCSYVQLTASINSWQSVSNTQFKLTVFLRPKMFK